MDQVQVDTKSLRTLAGRRGVLLWSSVFGSTEAVEGLTVWRLRGLGNEYALIFEFDKAIWREPEYPRDTRVVIRREGHAPHYPFLKKRSSGDNSFSMYVLACIGGAPVRVVAKRPPASLAKRDARRRAYREAMETLRSRKQIRESRDFH